MLYTIVVIVMQFVNNGEIVVYIQITFCVLPLLDWVTFLSKQSDQDQDPEKWSWNHFNND